MVHTINLYRLVYWQLCILSLLTPHCSPLYRFPLNTVVTSLEHLPPGLQISLSSRPNTPTSPLIARGNIKERGGRDSGIPHTPSSPSSPFPITPMGSTSGSSYKKLPLLRKTSSLSVSSSLSSSSRSLDVDSVSSKYATNTNVTDLESRRILRAVENEFKHWWKSHP